MVNVSWYIVLCAAWSQVNATLDWIDPQEHTTHLSKFTLQIARDHLSKLTSTLVITEMSFKPETRNTNILTLDYLLLNLQETTSVQLDSFHKSNQRWEYYIYIVDSAKSFVYCFIYNQFYSRYLTAPGQLHFLIILTTFSEETFINETREIFGLCYESGIINVNIIVDSPSLGACMFTYRLYACQIPIPELYFRFSEGFQNLKTVFPQKFANMNGCPMRVAARIMPPMLTFNGNKSDPKPVGNWENLSGFEGMLLKVLARSLNFTIKLLPWPDEKDDHDRRVLIMVKSHDADVAIGSLSASDVAREAFAVSRVYHNSPIVFVVRGGHLLGSLSRLATPFNYRLWILILVLLIAGTVAIQNIRCMALRRRRFIFGERNDSPYVNFNAVLLGYSITRTPGRNFARFILMQWVILTLVIRSAYQGSLYDAIRTNKFGRTPSGLDDLINWNYKILIPMEISFLDLFPVGTSIINIDANDTMRFKKLEGTQEKLATVALRESYIHYMNEAYRNGSDLVWIDQVVYMYQISMYFEEGSLYGRTDVFNKKLQSLAYSGITAYIASKFNRAPSVFSKNSQEDAKKALSNERLKAVYSIYIGMIALALIVFGLERLSIYSAKLRRIIEWLN